MVNRRSSRSTTEPNPTIPTNNDVKSNASKNYSPANDAADTIERIINAAESREATTREYSVATGAANNKPIEISDGGPFTASELSQLSLLRVEGWNALDPELVVSLTSMLQIHVSAGVGIDLVGEGRNVVLKSGEVGDGPVISAHQVS